MRISLSSNKMQVLGICFFLSKRPYFTGSYLLEQLLFSKRIEFHFVRLTSNSYRFLLDSYRVTYLISLFIGISLVFNVDYWVLLGFLAFSWKWKVDESQHSVLPSTVIFY